MNTWGNLPNAKHIDRVLASVKENPDKWIESYNEFPGKAYDAADPALCAALTAEYNDWYATLVAKAGKTVVEAANTAAWDAAWDAAVSVGSGMGSVISTYFAAGRAVDALIAYDDCAYMLDSTPDELRILREHGVKHAVYFIPVASS